ncbi:MAG: radical SAM protein [Patescibacteria group bacterium]|jgi:radical SAM superfamily enzyme YgiQ (UPF0313 family)
MKVLLSNPPCRVDSGDGKEKFFIRAGSRWPFSVTKKKEEKADYLPFPFYLAYTAALLEKKGFDIVVNDAVTLNKTEEEFLQEIVRDNPDIILFETSTPTINHDLVLVNKIKKLLPKIKIALAGPHVSTFFQETMKKSPVVDFIFIQEYELSFTELVERLVQGKTFDDITGLVWRSGEQIKNNPPKLIDPLDQLPPPARRFFPIDLYWDGFCQYRPAVQMHATRGCPFRCNFCLWNQVMYNNAKYRTFGVKRIVDEMKDCQKKYGAKEVYFDDDTFTGNKQFVLDFCREIKNRGLNIHWSCMGDAMITDEEMVEAMADAGCVGMKFGVESGDAEVLKKICKPVVHEKIKKVARLLAKKHIKTHATFTFGLSGETKESMKKTMDFAKELDVDSVQFSINTPFPGTRYYQESQEKGLLLAKDWSDYDGATSSIVKFENLTNEEVEWRYCSASGEWLRYKLKSPRWVLRQVYNFFRLLVGQGTVGAGQKLKRLFELIKS